MCLSLPKAILCILEERATLTTRALCLHFSINLPYRVPSVSSPHPCCQEHVLTRMLQQGVEHKINNPSDERFRVLLCSV